MKYGSNNYFNGTKRTLIFANDLDTFFWKENINKTFDTDDIKEVWYGRLTPNFARFPTKDQNRISCSFSIILEDRTIDLEA